MKRTLDDIQRHKAIIGDIIETIHAKLDGMETEERRHIMREVTITGLAVIGIKEGIESYDKVIDEASDRVIEFCEGKESTGNDCLIINGAINPRLKVAK